MLIWFMFALVGVQFFAGRLYHCNDPSFPAGAHRRGDTIDGIAIDPCDNTVMYNNTYGETVPREWVNSPSNFDNIISAMITLYVMATGEGWPSIMFQTTDITNVDYQPRRDNQPWNAYYFVLFIAITVFFFLELVIGAIFQNFIELKRKTELGLLTDDQRRWVDQQKQFREKEKPLKDRSIPDGLLFCQSYMAAQDSKHDDDDDDDNDDEGKHSRRPCPYYCIGCVNRMRTFMYRLVHHALFDILIAICILMNTFVLCASYSNMSTTYATIIEWLNFVFVVIFTFELILKFIAVGFIRFFRLKIQLQLKLPLREIFARCSQKREKQTSHDVDSITLPGDDNSSRERKTGEKEQEQPRQSASSSLASNGSATLVSGGKTKAGNDNPTNSQKENSSENLMRSERKCKFGIHLNLWNTFDFAIVVFSWFDFFFSFYNISSLRTLRLGRIMRITRLLRGPRAVRIIQFFKGLRGVFDTLVISLPSLLNVGSLLFLLFFIFAVLGTALFGKVCF